MGLRDLWRKKEKERRIYGAYASGTTPPSQMKKPPPSISRRLDEPRDER